MGDYSLPQKAPRCHALKSIYHNNARHSNRSSFLDLAFGRAIRQDCPVNTASQYPPSPLGLLQQKLQRATDYELALAYFLEEFAGDVQFMIGSVLELLL